MDYVIRMTPGDLILNARKAAESKNWNGADRLYKRAIRTLGKKKNESPSSKESYLSTKAEHLCQRPYCPDQESSDKFRNRICDAIRCLNECAKINKMRSKHYLDTMHELVQYVIGSCGCSWPETKHHVAVSCPIQLRSGKHGSMGCSVGATYKQALCSICGLDVLDEKCVHVANKIYGGKRCSTVYVGLSLKDISLVNRPKDPRCRITDIYYPKEEFLEDSGLGASKSNLKRKLGVQCTRCRDENIDSSSITPEIFLKIHGFNMSMDGPRLSSAMKGLEKGARGFSCIVSVGRADERIEHV